MIPVAHADVALVAPEIGGDDARAHVRAEAENRVADVVVVGNLNVVEDHGVLDLGRVADDAIFADERRAADERAVPHLGSGADHGRSRDQGGRCDLRRLVYPDLGRDLVVVLPGKGSAEFTDEVF